MRFYTGGENYVSKPKTNENGTRTVYVKDYEIGKTTADKVTYILEKSGMTHAELAKVLGYKSNEIHYIKGGYMPDNKNVISVINKLYRLW